MECNSYAMYTYSRKVCLYFCTSTVKQRSLNHALHWFVLAFKTAQINQTPSNDILCTIHDVPTSTDFHSGRIEYTVLTKLNIVPEMALGHFSLSDSSPYDTSPSDISP